MADEPNSPEPEPSVVSPPRPEPVEVTPLDLFDAAMAPFHARLTGIGLITQHELLAFSQALRSGLSAALGLTPPPVDNGGESLDMLGEQRRASREASVGQSEPVAVAVEAPAPPPAEAFDDVTPVAPPPPVTPAPDPVVTSDQLAADVEPPIA